MEAPDLVDSYVLRIDNGGYPESLEVRKLYAVLPDERAAVNNYIRVIDETGEDYLYPSKYFVPINCRLKLPNSCLPEAPCAMVAQDEAQALRSPRPRHVQDCGQCAVGMRRN